jgi:DtxR family Mn-dependent transcriptional regulator
MERIILSASMEDYLEVIFHLVQENQVARVKDIAPRLQVHKSSVTAALRTLADRQLINYTPYGFITLTSAGQTLAKDIVRRHEALREFFVKVLNIDAKIAEETACRMEHEMPQVVVDRLIQFSEFLDICPRGGHQWLHDFHHFCEEALISRDCQRCLSKCLEGVEERQKTGAKKTVSLKELPPRRKGIIVSFPERGEKAWSLQDLEIAPGTIVEVERQVGRGEPLPVKIMGYHLFLPPEEAEAITVELP